MNPQRWEACDSLVVAAPPSPTFARTALLRAGRTLGTCPHPWPRHPAALQLQLQKPLFQRKSARCVPVGVWSSPTWFGSSLRPVAPSDSAVLSPVPSPHFHVPLPPARRTVSCVEKARRYGTAFTTLYLFLPTLTHHRRTSRSKLHRNFLALCFSRSPPLSFSCASLEGTYGLVFKAEHPETHEVVAIKQLRLDVEHDGTLRSGQLEQARGVSSWWLSSAP